MEIINNTQNTTKLCEFSASEFWKSPILYDSFQLSYCWQVYLFEKIWLYTLIYVVDVIYSKPIVNQETKETEPITLPLKINLL